MTGEIPVSPAEQFDVPHLLVLDPDTLEVRQQLTARTVRIRPDRS